MTSQWVKTSQAGTPHRVKEFFHSLVATLLGGDIEKNDKNGLGDVVNFDLSFGVEIKASDNGHPWRIDVEQKARHADTLPFPLTYYLYTLCGYKNRNWVKKNETPRRDRRSRVFQPLARIKAKVDQFRYLESKVHEVYVLDLAILTAIEQWATIRRGDFAAKPHQETFRVHRAPLRTLKADPGKDLTARGLDASKFRWFEQEVAVEMALPTVGVFRPRFSLFVLAECQLMPYLQAEIEKRVMREVGVVA